MRSADATDANRRQQTPTDANKHDWSDLDQDDVIKGVLEALGLKPGDRLIKVPAGKFFLKHDGDGRESIDLTPWLGEPDDGDQGE